MVVVHGREPGATVTEVERTLAADPAVTTVAEPLVSRDGRTVVVQAGAGADPNDMVRAADDLKGRLAALGGDGVEVNLTGARCSSPRSCHGP